VKGGVQVNHNLNLERLSTRVKKEDKEWLLDYMHETRSHSLGEAIGRLIEEQKGTGQLSASELSPEIQAVDFQTKVITEMLNHMINTLQIDRIEEQVVLTTKAKTNALMAAEKLINEKLNNRF
jgi:hypothetical protein